MTFSLFAASLVASFTICKNAALICQILTRRKYPLLSHGCLMCRQLTYPRRLTLHWRLNATNVCAPYTRQTVLNYVPKYAGVYVLCYLCSEGYSYDFYVGQANNLQRRLLEHLSFSESSCIQQAIFQPCGFQYASVEHPTHRNAAEAAIYYQAPNQYLCTKSQGLPALDPHYIVEVGF